jgi:hypothetical protein
MTQAEQQLRKAGAPVEIEKSLNEQGAEGLKNAGRKNMRYGALWFISGIVLMALSYLAEAAGVGGGRNILAWGAILFGSFRSSARDGSRRAAFEPKGS